MPTANKSQLGTNSFNFDTFSAWSVYEIITHPWAQTFTPVSLTCRLSLIVSTLASWSRGWGFKSQQRRGNFLIFENYILVQIANKSQLGNNSINFDTYMYIFCLACVWDHQTHPCNLCYTRIRNTNPDWNMWHSHDSRGFVDQLTNHIHPDLQDNK